MIQGRVKVGYRTKDLAGRLFPGEIAVIDHHDLDGVAARSLVKAGVRAVLNASQATTGRFPNLGPEILIRNGIPLIDCLGHEVMNLPEGQTVTVRDKEIWAGDRLWARGRVFTREMNEDFARRAEAALTESLEEFFTNTVEHASRETRFFFNKPHLPRVQVLFSGRPAVVVARGNGFQEDLRSLRRYIDSVKPVLVGVDGGADALKEIGCCPDLVIGDMDSVTDQALIRAKERVVHAYSDGRAPGADRLRRLGLSGEVWPAPGTSEDIALLLAFELGARPVITVGSHSSPLEFLEKGRSGMGSTLLVRMKLGTALIDAKGLSALTGPELTREYYSLASLAALAPVAAAVVLSPGFQILRRLIWLKLRLVLDL